MSLAAATAIALALIGGWVALFRAHRQFERVNATLAYDPMASSLRSQDAIEFLMLDAMDRNAIAAPVIVLEPERELISA